MEETIQGVKITLTEFVDFVIKAGTPKLTVVKNAKQRREVPYEPRFDFYKPIRDGLVAHHQTGAPLENLDGLSHTNDDKKRDSYAKLVAGHKKFLGKREAIWVKPSRCVWEYEGLQVAVNPELGLKIDGQKHILKLYFKDAAPNKRQLEVIVHLMQLGLGKMGSLEPHGLLDVRRGKVVSSSMFKSNLSPLLEGEAQAFLTMYNAL